MFYKPGENALCQDCLRVNEYTLRRHNGLDLCVCGGEFCGCPQCIETLNALYSGKRSAKELGLQKDINAWNPNDGIGRK